MEKASILSYQLVDFWDPSKPTYRFKNLASIPKTCKKPEECKITCLTYQRNNDIERVREELGNEIFDMGYRTKEEFEENIIQGQKRIQENTLKSWLNPFEKNKSRNLKIGAVGMLTTHAAPFVMIPAAFFTSCPASSVLIGGGVSLAVYDVMMGFVRKGDVSREKKSIRNIEEKFKSPENEYFCELREMVPKVDVENVLVEDAHLLIENMKADSLVKLSHWWGETKKEVDYSLVNVELNKIYEDYAQHSRV